MFSLNSREQLLIVAVLVVTVLGAAVKHWRDARREGFVFGRHVNAPAVSIQKLAGDGLH